MLRIKHNQSPASQLLVEAEHKSEMAATAKPLLTSIQNLEDKLCALLKSA